MSYLLIMGNPADGFGYVGPFDSVEGATEWAEEVSDTDWWVVEMTSPDPDALTDPEEIDAYARLMEENT